MLAILFTAVIVFFAGTIIERVVRYSFLKQNPYYYLFEVKPETDYTGFFEKLFPFKDEDENEARPQQEEHAPAEQQTRTGIPGAVKTKMESLKSDFEYYTEKLLFARMQFISLNAKLNKVIGMKIIENSESSVISLLDGNLTFKPEYYDTTEAAKAISDFSADLKKEGIDLVYVQVPSKVDSENNLLPYGIEDYENQTADEFLSKINGVKYIDLRELMHEQNIDYTEAFYKTDHHWTSETSFWAAGEVADFISKNTSVKIDTSKFDVNKYIKKTFKNCSLGSLGKIVTSSYVSPEDFTIYLPKYETDFHYYSFYEKTDISGPFEKSLVDMSVFESKDLYNVSAYGTYLYNNPELVKIDNKLSENDTSILILGDSFKASVVPYFAPSVKTVYSMNTGFTGSIRSFVEQYKPELVVIMIYPPTLSFFNKGVR